MRSAGARTGPTSNSGRGSLILVGTSGWSYDDWVGPVYPAALRSHPGEWLAHYADGFGTVEINSTFYRIPAKTVVDGWLRKAADLGAFEFSAKAPQDATHETMVRGDADATRAALAPFVETVARPLAAAGRLGAILLQLSPRFVAGEDALAQLDLACEALAPHAVAVEPRHRSWAPQGQVLPELLALLDRRGAALAAVDGPGFPPRIQGAAPHAYVRFHGRRPDAWFEGRHDDSRYDYLYDESELAPWSRAVAAVAARKEVVRVYFNNHPGGQAVVNARQFAAMAGVVPPLRPAKPRQKGLDEFG